MKKIKKLFLVRHADYDGGGSDPSLSPYGRNQSTVLGSKISDNLVPGNITIWSSSANRAKETAELIKQELQLADMRIEGKLWSDNRHPHDFPWLENELNSFEGDNLIIVSHYAEGVIIENGTCKLFR